MVKTQYNYQGSHSDPRAQGQPQSRVSNRVPKHIPGSIKPQLVNHSEASFTLYSRADDSELELDQDPTPVSPVRSRHPAKFDDTEESYIRDVDGHSPVAKTRWVHDLPDGPRQGRRWEADVSDTTEDYVPSTTPPSYRVAVRDPRFYKEQSPRLSLTPSTRLPGGDSARKVVALARERRGSVVNEQNAWNKIKMERDERDADAFWSDRLLERCWGVWKQGFQWIITTNQQVGKARDSLLLRLSLQRWRKLTTSRREVYRRVKNLSDNRCLRSAIGLWRAKLNERNQSRWREEIRTKMKTIKDKLALRLRKDAWAKWRQSYLSHLSGQHYTEHLLFRFYCRWKERLSGLEELEHTAELHLGVVEQRWVGRCWNLWKRASDMRNAERILLGRVNLRLTGNIIDIWRKHAVNHHTATIFYINLLKKSVIRSWKASRDRINVMEYRAAKHAARQDGVLLRAVSRVWRARERGKLLERVKAARLIKETWAVWKRRLRQQRHNHDVAVAFFLHSKTGVAASSLQRWRQSYASHQNAKSFAVQYHSTQLRYKMVLLWRIHLRENLRLTRMARVACQFFVTRHTWKAWGNALKARARERYVKDMEKRRLEKIFHRWLHRSRQTIQRTLAEQTTRDRVTKRILKQSLCLWTNRVIEVKLREYEVTHRYDTAVKTLALKKWKDLCVRHVEELSLMESYQFVKREENIRRIFHKWLTRARTTRQRRIILQQKENEIKFSVISSAWDKWRDRFCDERLRLIEYDVNIQTQKNLTFRAFGIWHSKTKSLPAIRFHATHAKLKFFKMWRRAMPGALLAKEARERDKTAVLSKFFDKWVQSLRTKMALKAVARARYLRLPTAVPRQAIHSRGIPTTSPMTPVMLPRKTAKSITDGDVDASRWSRSKLRTGPPSTLADTRGPSRTRYRPETSPPRSSSRASAHSPAASKPLFSNYNSRNSSPTRSTGKPPNSSVGERGRSRLWLELQELQSKSRPSSQRSGDP